MAEPNKKKSTTGKRPHLHFDNDGNEKKTKKQNKKFSLDRNDSNDGNMDINEDSIIPASFITKVEKKNKQQLLLAQASLLNFQHTDNGKRPSRQTGGQSININHNKHTNALMKWKIIAIASILGWSPCPSNRFENKKAAEAAINLVCYDNGMDPINYKTFCKWAKLIDESLDGIKNNLGTDLLERKEKADVKYHTIIEKKAPGYILSIFREAQTVVGVEATFTKLAEAMNWISLKENKNNQEKPELKFTRNTLFSWFHSVNGVVKKRISRPILDDKRKEDRVKWCQEMQQLQETGEKKNEPVIITYLDEKFCYTSSGRKKQNIYQNENMKMKNQ